jgi:hypothetical protein
MVEHTVFRTPDDGRKEHPKHVEESCIELKYRVLSVASRGKMIYIRLVTHGTVNVEFISRLEESYRMWCVVVCDLETS